MKKKCYYIIFSLFCFCVQLTAFAQDSTAGDKKVEMADGLRASGKIYVVVAVVITILAGIVLYLLQLDRKIKKLEKDN